MPSPAPPAAPCRAPTGTRRPGGTPAPPPRAPAQQQTRAHGGAGRGGQGAQPESRRPGESPACAEPCGGRGLELIGAGGWLGGTWSRADRCRPRASRPWDATFEGKDGAPLPLAALPAERSGRPSPLHGPHVSGAPAGCQVQNPPQRGRPLSRRAEKQVTTRSFQGSDKRDEISRGPRDSNRGRGLEASLLRTGHLTGDPKDGRVGEVTPEGVCTGF